MDLDNQNTNNILHVVVEKNCYIECDRDKVENDDGDLVLINSGSLFHTLKTNDVLPRIYHTKNSDKKVTAAKSSSVDRWSTNLKPTVNVLCEHNRKQYCCKDCGGKGICEHVRLGFYFKEFVNTADNNIVAYLAEERACVSMTAGAICAKIAEERAFVSMTASAICARIAGERAFVSMAAGAICATIAKERSFVNKSSSPTIAMHLLTRIRTLTRSKV